jgi:hypothetical protein
MFFSVILNVMVFALQHDIRRFDISTHAHVHVHFNVNVHVLVYVMFVTMSVTVFMSVTVSLSLFAKIEIFSLLHFLTKFFCESSKYFFAKIFLTENVC